MVIVYDVVYIGMEDDDERQEGGVSRERVSQLLRGMQDGDSMTVHAHPKDTAEGRYPASAYGGQG